MVVVAVAGASGTGKTAIAARLSGKRPENPVSRRLAITNGIAEDQPFTLLDSPAFELDLHDALTGICLADILIIAVDGRRKVGDTEKQIVELASALGKSKVVVAINGDVTESLRNELAAILAANGLAGPVVAADEVDATISSAIASSQTNDELPATRVWAQRVFRKVNVGTVVIGIVSGQSLSPHDMLVNTTNNRRSKIRALQVAGEGVEAAESGAFVAINVSDFDVHGVSPGSLLVTNPNVVPTNVFECAVDVMSGSAKPLAANHIYGLHFGSVVGYTMLNILSSNSLAAGEKGTVRMHVAKPLPLKPGDRLVMTDVETHRPIAVATVNSLSPQLDGLEASDSAELLRARGWIDVDEYESLFGKPAATVGRWVVDISALEEATSRLRVLIANAGTAGLDISSLSERERAVLQMMSGVVISNGRAFISGIEPDFDMRPAQNATLSL